MAEHEVVSMAEIERRHRGHWFSSGAKQFFACRLASFGYKITDEQGTRVYFVSSERFLDPLKRDGYSGGRLYSVRVLDWETGDIDTVGEFQQYTTGKAADRAARKLAGY